MARVKIVERSTRAVRENRSSSFTKRKMNLIRWNEMNLSREKDGYEKSWKIVKRARKIVKNLTTFVGRPWEGYMTVCVQLFALAILALMIVDETNNYREKPTGTAVEDAMYPVQAIDFPAIAICNINIISRRKVFHFADELWGMEKVRNMKNLTREKIADVLKYMGHLITFMKWESEHGDIELLHKILINAFGPNYTVPLVMMEIVPSCRRYIEHCSWRGEIRSCEQLFLPRWTQDGRCCTFNYVRWKESFSGEQSKDFSFHIEQTKYSGNEYGLRVFLNPLFDDGYYRVLPGRGFKVLIFTATDYPDAPSGGLKEHLVGPGSEYYFRVKGTSFYSSPDVIQYDKDKRRCLFMSELSSDFEGTYSYSQCLMLCRARDIVKTCGCVPFFYPYPKDFETSRDCTVMDLPCLRTSRYKWWSLKPIKDEVENLWDKDELVHENLECDCLPTCEVVDYAVFQTGSQIHHYDVSLIDFIRNYSKDNVTKHSILLNVCFEHPTIIRLRQDVLYYWYDLMSAYGGLCSMFLGLSILTPVELIYRLCVRMWWGEGNKKSNKLSRNNELPKIVESSKLKEQPIYWKELMQKKRRY